MYAYVPDLDVFTCCACIYTQHLCLCEYVVFHGVLRTSSPVELGISGCVSAGEDRRAGEGCVKQRRGQSLITLLCGERKSMETEEWEKEHREGKWDRKK